MPVYYPDRGQAVHKALLYERISCGHAMLNSKRPRQAACASSSACPPGPRPTASLGRQPGKRGPLNSGKDDDEHAQQGRVDGEQPQPVLLHVAHQEIDGQEPGDSGRERPD